MKEQTPLRKSWHWGLKEGANRVLVFHFFLSDEASACNFGARSRPWETWAQTSQVRVMKLVYETRCRTGGQPRRRAGAQSWRRAVCGKAVKLTQKPLFLYCRVRCGTLFGKARTL